jgi:hypothetical protein
MSGASIRANVDFPVPDKAADRDEARTRWMQESRRHGEILLRRRLQLTAPRLIAVHLR